MSAGSKEHHPKLVHRPQPPIDPLTPRRRPRLRRPPQLADPQLPIPPHGEVSIILSFPDRAVPRLPEHFARGDRKLSQLLRQVNGDVVHGIENVIEDVCGQESSSFGGGYDPGLPFGTGVCELPRRDEPCGGELAGKFLEVHHG